MVPAINDHKIKQQESLFAAIENLVVPKEWRELPDERRYNGTGGPGNYLEDQLGVQAGNMDIADPLG